MQRTTRTPARRRPRRATLAVSLACASMASACIVPVAPEFQDPERNYAPYIIEAQPAQGSVISVNDGVDPEFEVRLIDPNAEDRLFVRWTIDYPPFGDQSRLARDDSLPQASDRNGTRSTFRPNCILHSIARGFTQHRITMSVADREFSRADQGSTAHPDEVFDTVPLGAFRARATWFVNMECK